MQHGDLRQVLVLIVNLKVFAEIVYHGYNGRANHI